MSQGVCLKLTLAEAFMGAVHATSQEEKPLSLGEAYLHSIARKGLQTEKTPFFSHARLPRVRDRLHPF